MFQTVKLRLHSPKQGTSLIWSHLVWHLSLFPSRPQLPSLHITPASQVSSSTCTCGRLLPAAPDANCSVSAGCIFHPDSCTGVPSSRKLCTPVFSPITALVTLGHNCPPGCSFRPETIFIHVTRRVLGTWPISQCWLNEPLRTRGPGQPGYQGPWTGWENAFLTWTSCPALFLHSSPIIGILCPE